MAYLNKATIIGNLGKDPEIKLTPTGKKKVSFSVATTRKYHDSNNELKELTSWHNIIGWGKIADIIEKVNLRKGMCVYIDGEITYRSWEDQNGQHHNVTEIVINDIQILTKRDSTQDGVYNGGRYPDQRSPYDQQSQPDLHQKNYNQYQEPLLPKQQTLPIAPDVYYNNELPNVDMTNDLPF